MLRFRFSVRSIRFVFFLLVFLCFSSVGGIIVSISYLRGFILLLRWSVMEMFNVWLATASLADMLAALITIHEALCETGGPADLCGWRIRNQSGYYSMRRRIDGRQRTVYIGKDLTGDALAKAMAKAHKIERGSTDDNDN